MIAVLLDILGGWLSSRYIPNVFLAVVSAIILGVGASFAGAYLILLLTSDVFSEREIAVRAVSGLIWHPLLAVGATLYFRYRRRKAVRNRGVADT